MKYLFKKSVVIFVIGGGPICLMLLGDADVGDLTALRLVEVHCI